MLSMERIESLDTLIPVLRVNNRENNLTFFRNLGFKVWHEENAFSDLGAAGRKEVKLVLEESPSMRSRQVVGPKKLSRILIKVAKAEEIEGLLAKGLAYDKLYRGKIGWAFEILSPENDLFLLHSEETIADLVQVTDQVVFETSTAIVDYLTDFEVEEISINAVDPVANEAFYSKLFDSYEQLTFVKAEGPDLQADNEETWDLSALEMTLKVNVSLTTLQAELAALGVRSFVDKRATFLVFQDPSGLDLVFRA